MKQFQGKVLRIYIVHKKETPAGTPTKKSITMNVDKVASEIEVFEMKPKYYVFQV